MRDAKGMLRCNFINLFGSAAKALRVRETEFVRLRTPLYECEHEVRKMFENEMRASFRTCSPGKLQR